MVAGSCIPQTASFTSLNNTVPSMYTYSSAAPPIKRPATRTPSCDFEETTTVLYHTRYYGRYQLRSINYAVVILVIVCSTHPPISNKSSKAWTSYSYSYPVSYYKVVVVGVGVSVGAVGVVVVLLVLVLVLVLVTVVTQ